MMQTNLLGEHIEVFELEYRWEDETKKHVLTGTTLVIATGIARMVTIDPYGNIVCLLELDAGQRLFGRTIRPGELMQFSAGREVLFRVSSIPPATVSSGEQP